ncbi:MAG: hypothetical protein KF696_03460 [Planctomycetes bacterium]|nr:hypothetical protein [Planctomycetota bacterium]MCW8135064.1 hypothetical protein [Planctomycetota bacterium]
MKALPYAALLLACVLVAACSNPRANPPANNAPDQRQPDPDREAQTVRLRVSYNPGDRFRTTRTLTVAEKTDVDDYYTTSEELTLTTVLRVDESGRMLAVQRAWELSASTLSVNRGTPQQVKGELDGCTLELTQRSSGVDARVLVGNVDVGRQQFVIEGFDAGLLPADPVRRGDTWTLEDNQLSGLNRLIEALEFKVQTNRLICAVAKIETDAVFVSLDWRVTAEYAGKPAVLRFGGELRYDRALRLVSDFKLSGGRLGDSTNQQVEISVKRRPAQGWLDFGD